MVRSLKWFLIGIFFIFLKPNLLLGEEVQAVDSLFFRSVSAYQQGDYTEALQLLELLNEVYPGHVRTTATYLMQGKTLYKLHRYQVALDIYNKIIDQFPGSHYVDDAYYGLGTVFYRRKMYQDAVIQFLKIVDAEWDTRLQVPAAKISSDIMDYFMNEEDLQALLDMVSGEKARAAVTIRLARRGLTQRHYQATKNLLESFLNTYPKSPYVDQVKKLLDQAYLLGEATLKVGVILPVTNEEGKALLEGI
ncbi:tetratricopeptide repeat protein, partial [bacterium]|nr:tetratricopeptide repeat protein [bacterium]